MKEYVTKRREVEAVELESGAMLSIGDWLGEPLVKIGDDVFIGEVAGRFGQMVVRYPNGSFECLPSGEFNRRYEEKKAPVEAKAPVKKKA